MLIFFFTLKKRIWFVNKKNTKANLGSGGVAVKSVGNNKKSWKDLTPPELAATKCNYESECRFCHVCLRNHTWDIKGYVNSRDS